MNIETMLTVNVCDVVDKVLNSIPPLFVDFVVEQGSLEIEY